MHYYHVRQISAIHEADNQTKSLRVAAIEHNLPLLISPPRNLGFKELRPDEFINSRVT